MAFSLTAISCASGEQETIVALETTAGTIRLKLYDDTPGHRDNFLQNVKQGLYDGVTFHRIIRNFMIQTGDPFTRPGEVVDTTKKDPTIPAEIVYPRHYHKRGSIGAAREGDDENPRKESNKFQFYIVTGKHYSDAGLSELEGIAYQNKVEKIYNENTKNYTARLDAMRRQRDRDGVSDLLDSILTEAQTEVAANPPAPFTSEQKRIYKSRGGSPWLDGEYTVFGEVVEGLDVVERIQNCETSLNDRPKSDIAMEVTVMES